MLKIIRITLITIFALLSIVLIGLGSWLIYMKLINSPLMKNATNSDNTFNNRNIVNTTNLVRSFNPIVSSNRSTVFMQEDTCGQIDTDNRIINGNITQLFEFPWMVRLAYSSDASRLNTSEILYLCGGSLISDRYVLTAAHCLNTAGYKLQFIRLGEYNTTEEIDCEPSPLGERVCSPAVQDIEVEELIPHPNFNQTTFQNDIALIKLARPANTSVENVKTICLPQSQELVKFKLPKVIVTGWGITQQNSIKQSDVLLKTELSILENDICRDRYNKTRNMIPIRVNEHICVVGPVNMNTCMGDSGGPGQMYYAPQNGSNLRYYIFGVISFGNAICDDTQFPSVQTRVTRHLEWINSVLLA